MNREEALLPFSPRTAQRRVAAAILTLVIAVLAVMAGRTAWAGGVVIGDGSPDGSAVFTPNTVTITAGDTVTFAWVDGTHDARDAQSGAIYLPLSTSAKSQTTTFSNPGTYYFYCSVHAKASDATDANVAAGTKQVGKIIVLPAVADTPTAPPAASPPPAPTAATTAPTGGTPVAASTTPLASPAPALASSPSPTSATQGSATSATATGGPFIADVSVSTAPAAPAAPAAGSGLATDAQNDPLPRWLEAVAVFAAIAAVILTATVRTMRRP
jgi:plastocyanin